MMKTNISKHNQFNSPIIFLWLLATTIAVAGLLFGRSAPAAGQESEEPVRVFSSYWGGSLSECAHFDRCASTIDQAGNIYVVGPTDSDDFPLANPLLTSFASSSFDDLFVTKIDGQTKQVLFSSYLGNGQARGVAIDSAGNIVVVGSTYDSDFTITNDAAQSTFGGGISDGVIVKLSPDGSEVLYSTFLGGSDDDELIDVIVDAADDIYVTGWSSSANYPVTFNPAQAAFGGNQDTVVTKILSTGGFFYSTYLGGDQRDRGVGLAVDSAGSLAIVGSSGSDNFPTTAGALQTVRSSTASYDATITKLSPLGAITYSTFYGTGGLNDGVAIDLDRSGNSYVLTSHDGVIKLDPTLSQLIYSEEFELTVGNNTGNLLAAGGQGDIDVDSEGIAFITGWVGQTTDKDVVLAAISTSGQLIHYQTVGGSDTDQGYSLDLIEAEDGKKTAYIIGRTESSDFPTLNAAQDSLAGGSDVFMVEITNLETIGFNLIYLPLIIR
ncbi:MAG: SBBP repeat-containing protein [Chloroflexota bacterium]